MKITKQILRMDAERLLETLKEEKISSLEEALHVIGSEFVVREILPDRVCVHLRPSNASTMALKISYES